MPFMQQDPRRLVWQQNDRYLWIETLGARTACAYAAAVICR
ncbi:hydrolase [Salmonella enterica subsp. enterica]|uniref:Hydrolase n=1 Tax=Salmonella enterica I TaxID=59201 RepID=A0A379VYC9_SALET|nr:hydrolase [Salmonella enterica subsp. enterica]